MEKNKNEWGVKIAHKNVLRMCLSGDFTFRHRRKIHTHTLTSLSFFWTQSVQRMCETVWMLFLLKFGRTSKTSSHIHIYAHSNRYLRSDGWLADCSITGKKSKECYTIQNLWGRKPFTRTIMLCTMYTLEVLISSSSNVFFCQNPAHFRQIVFSNKRKEVISLECMRMKAQKMGQLISYWNDAKKLISMCIIISNFHSVTQIE